MFTFNVKVCTADKKFIFTTIAPCSSDVIEAAINEFEMPYTIFVTARGAV